MIGQRVHGRHKVELTWPQVEWDDMLRVFAIFMVFLPSFAVGEEWVPLLQDDEIQEALNDRAVRYDALTFQYFNKDGSTRFITERSSDGRWAARGGQYCSVWPPSDIWTCYDFQVNGDRVRFISSDRSVSEGTYEN